MIQKLLIANRGEIACRIMRTSRGMGIRTVAVYSDADRDALHVASADEAVRIGPAEAAASYLDVDAIIGAALATKADAIHPGYGFLSERVELAKRCAEHGIVWVGPSPDAIRRMGSKIESKRIAEEAGVASVPGYHGDAQDDAALEKAAKEIGFPVLIKASAGGGGRGMRRVEKPKDLRPALALARAEAQAGFGDPALLIEKLIVRPRHIEVQLAGDKHGNLVHLFERECSIQRNYQKVIEEAPAPNLAPETRTKLFAAATRLGRAIGYDSLGTVEFILDADGGGPWFLEMNTRLQVEHPVTEAITGLDLVEWQIRIAVGEKLPLEQDAIKPQGWAIEARLNAEDPAAEYHPCFGTVTGFHVPVLNGVRIDTGIRAGSVVTSYYNSLLAKVIGQGPDRAAAAARLSAALHELVALGVGTNQTFLRDLVDTLQFRVGNLTTRFIGEVFPDGWKNAAAGPLGGVGVGVAVAVWAEALERRQTGSGLGPWIALGGFRLLAPAGKPARVTVVVERPDEVVELELSGGGGRFVVKSPGREIEIALIRQGDELQATISDATTGAAAGAWVGRYFMVIDGDTIWLASDGRAGNYRVAPAIERAGQAPGGDASGGGTRVVATMPGMISALKVELGQSVAKGDTVIVLEAMKLMHSLPAAISGRVSAIFCAAGETVAAGAVLVEIEPREPQ